MKHYFFINDEENDGEEFIVGAETKAEAIEIAKENFDKPKFHCTLTDIEAESSGLDEY